MEPLSIFYHNCNSIRPVFIPCFNNASMLMEEKINGWKFGSNNHQMEVNFFFAELCSLNLDEQHLINPKRISGGQNFKWIRYLYLAHIPPYSNQNFSPVLCCPFRVWDSLTPMICQFFNHIELKKKDIHLPHPFGSHEGVTTRSFAPLCMYGIINCTLRCNNM